MDLTPASEFPLRELSTLFSRAFEGYFVKVPDVPLLFDARMRSEHISLLDSRIARTGGEPVGLVLIARRGRVSRIAAMGIVPAHRNRRLGGAMLSPLLDEARARGDIRMMLEVIEQNTPAVKLYERLGFQRVRRLVGFVGKPEPEPAPLKEVEPEECARLLPEGLPWQLSPSTVAGLAGPARAFRLGPAVAVLGDLSAPTLALRAIAVEPKARGKGAGSRLLRAMAAAHPGKPLAVSVIVPEGPCERFFLRAGLLYPALSQFEMVHSIGSL
ncbi:GNAT family N-acetyltransferase [Stigmatella aurantiaca]|uniref:acetyltransferase, GNAT family n=1 Tax=Stigmatella aurantiaca (strain DW4/3-1) TaxID=378806 RepID=Q08WB8_STIAD|nr:GNAT family N-acetyltransferase [Stigmatella aurantiaca]ADO69269.1 Acetyltransferase, GNAT family [Stigmatella aurantiaca DW4/3-1]EAU64771.1 acetyltransferase, gnat family [Stigmatella aurantiaca DW4/3-1]